jgi:hypothetical protein
VKIGIVAVRGADEEGFRRRIQKLAAREGRFVDAPAIKASDELLANLDHVFSESLRRDVVLIEGSAELLAAAAYGEVRKYIRLLEQWDEPFMPDSTSLSKLKDVAESVFHYANECERLTEIAGLSSR